MDPTLQARRDNCLSVNSRLSTVTFGEGAGRPSQNRAGGSSVYRIFSPPICHVEGDLME